MALSHDTFDLSQPVLTAHLNRYWREYGMRPGPVFQYDWKDGPVHPSVFWFEWNAMVIAWNRQRPDAHALQQVLFRQVKVNGLNAADAQPDGYLWPETTNPRWFGRQYHFDHLPRFLCGLYRYIIWTGDRQLLRDMMPIARRVMGFLWTSMDGQQGVVRCPGNNTGLPHTGEVSTYMDCTRSGYVDGWINAGWHLALEQMAQLELISGCPDRAARYRQTRLRLLREFDRQLWNPDTRRYAGWRDAAGKLHDCGYTYVNLEALANGLGDGRKAADVFDWLDHGRAQPAVQGAHKGSDDIYRMAVAPVTNTIRIPNEDWDPWSHVHRNEQGDAYEFGYGNHVTDGGAMLWLNYYDVMARLRWQSADTAYLRWTRMLDRCAADSRFLRYGVKGAPGWRNYTDAGEHFLGLGTDYDFPESGISATSVLFGFMGVDADIHGLHVTPNLPNGLVWARVHGVTHRGRTLDITVARGHIITERAPGTSAYGLSPQTPLTESISVSQRYDQVGVFLETDGTRRCMVTMRLDRLSSGKRVCVAAQRVPVTHQAGWCYLSVPRQPPGRYLLTLHAADGQVKWRRGTDDPGLAVQAVQCRHRRALYQWDCKHPAEWTPAVPFCRVLYTIGGDVNSAVCLGMERWVINRWVPLSQCTLIQTDPDGNAALDSAPQPAGRYRLSATHQSQVSIRGVLSTQYAVSIAQAATERQNSVTFSSI